MLLFRDQLDYDIFNERISNSLDVEYSANKVPVVMLTHNSDTIKPWNAGLKGQQIPWNKGLTKNDPRVLKYCKPKTEEHKKKISKTLNGHVVTDETRKKMSEKKKGKTAWNKGKNVNSENMKRVKVSNGSKIFDSVKSAAEHEKVSSGAIIGRIKRNSGWYYVNIN
jgi:hypothetical protein